MHAEMIFDSFDQRLPAKNASTFDEFLASRHHRHYHQQKNKMAPPGSAHLNFTLGGLVMIGGVMGYVKKKSVMSAAAGLTFGGLLIGSGVLISQGESYKGHALATGATGVMTLAMGQRFLSTGKFMPAGMVAALGAAGLAYNLQKTLEWMPDKDGK